MYSCHLVDDEAEAPHIDGMVIGDTKENFWCAIVPALDVSETILVLSATAAKVDNLDRRVRLVCEHDVLRLQVAVNDLDLNELLQANQNLLGYLTQ